MRAPTPKPQHPDSTHKPSVRMLSISIYGQIIMINKIYYGYLHMKSGVVCPRRLWNNKITLIYM